MKILKKIGKIAGITLGSILALFIVVVLVLSSCRNIMYKEFYANATEVVKQPGLDTKYVQQGMTFDKETDTFLFSGYMSDKTASRVYVINSEQKVGYIELVKDNGKPFTGHVGGIAIHGDYVYISNANKVYVLDYDEIVNNAYATDKQQISMRNFEVNNDGSFAYADKDGLWVGEFHSDPDYPTDEAHHVSTVGGDEHGAWVSYYPYATGTNDEPEAAEFGLKTLTPTKILTLRDKVQGFAITDSGKILLSCSLSIYHAYVYVYNPVDLSKVDRTIIEDDTEIPVYDLDSRYLSKTLRIPPMSEALVYNDGQVYISFESACAKYRIFNIYPVTHVMAYPID